MTGPTAILALTRPAIVQAGRVAGVLPDATLVVPARFQGLAAEQAPGADRRILGYAGPLRARIGALFATHAALIGILSLGALIRLLAPHLRDKIRDPAVLVLDEGGRFVIPVLSGHLGGANVLALRLAAALGATPVLTTASDCQHGLAADLLGRELGWILEADRDTLLHASAALVNGEPVALIQEAGALDWWSGHAGGRTGPPPTHLHRWSRLEDVDPDNVAAVLWVSRRAVPAALAAALRGRLVVYRPPLSVALGLGCDRGTPAGTLAHAVAAALASAGLTRDQVAAVGSIDLKSDEPGLLDYLAAQGWPIRFHPADALAAVPVPNPSERVRAITGTPSVSEAAALLAAGWPGACRLLVEKYRHRGPDGRNVTVSIASID